MSKSGPVPAAKQPHQAHHQEAVPAADPLFHADPKMGTHPIQIHGAQMQRHIARTILAGAAVAALAACGSSPRQPYRPVPEEVRVEPMASADAQAVTLHALGLVGTPYRYGGNTPEAGFDCSGLIGYVMFHAAQRRAPRTVNELAGWGVPIPREDLRSGDLVLFGPRGALTHAGIYVGQGRFVHAPSTGGTVRLDHLGSPHWARQTVAFRRP
jgi:cell wall-associated NlpC family hydrolase